MSRPLKFRAWNKTHKQMWHDGGHMDLSISLDGIIGSPDSYYGQDQSDDFVIMQYTGLKDRYGFDVYQDDLVEFETYEDLVGITKDIYRVVWNGLWACWQLDNLTNRIRGVFGHPYNYEIPSLSVDGTIVGNIHENPELLEAKS